MSWVSTYDERREERERKREAFAGLAMQGILACVGPHSTTKTRKEHDRSIAARAVELADALIEELERTAK